MKKIIVICMMPLLFSCGNKDTNYRDDFINKNNAGKEINIPIDNGPDI